MRFPTAAVASIAVGIFGSTALAGFTSRGVLVHTIVLRHYYWFGGGCDGTSNLSSWVASGCPSTDFGCGSLNILFEEWTPDHFGIEVHFPTVPASHYAVQRIDGALSFSVDGDFQYRIASPCGFAPAIYDVTTGNALPSSCGSVGTLARGRPYQLVFGQLFWPSGSNPTMYPFDLDLTWIPPACPGDVTEDGIVDGIDLAALLGSWGTDGQGQFPCDTDHDGVVSGTDLAALLSSWGQCGK